MLCEMPETGLTLSDCRQQQTQHASGGAGAGKEATMRGRRTCEPAELVREGCRTPGPLPGLLLDAIVTADAGEPRLNTAEGACRCSPCGCSGASGGCG